MIISTSEVMRAIQAQRGIPSIDRVRKTLRTRAENVAYALQVDSRVAIAWKRKALAEVRKLTLSELLSTRGTKVLRSARVPEVFDHVRRRILKRISTFNGRPSLAHLANHVTGDKGAKTNVLRRDPIVSRAAEHRMLAILKKMSDAQIRAQRLDRNAGKISKEIDEYLRRRLGTKRLRL